MVITMELIAEIRRRHFVGGESISALSRSVGLSRPTVRKHLLTTTAPVYSRAVKPGRRLGCFEDRLLSWLELEKRKPARERRTAQRLYEGLREEGYEGAYDSVQRYVQRWKRNNHSGATASGTGIKAAFVHLPFRLVRRVSSTGVKNVLRLAELSRPSKSHISVWRTAASVLWLAVHGNAKRWCLMLMPMFE